MTIEKATSVILSQAEEIYDLHTKLSKTEKDLDLWYKIAQEKEIDLKNATSDPFSQPDPNKLLVEENKRLHKEIAQLKEELELLTPLPNFGGGEQW